MKKRLAALGCAVIVAWNVTACGSDGTSGECTLIGCGAPFEVEFVRSGGWPAGDYRVQVDADGQRTVCDITVPFTCQQSAVCDRADPGFFVTLSGCALDPSQESIGGVVFHGENTPANVTVEVFLDGASLGSGSFTPTYTESHPNGPDCEPTCKTAPSARLTLQ